MKTLAEINAHLQAWHKKFGLPVEGLTQRSIEWLDIRLGLLTASNAYRIVAKEDSDRRATYMAELVAQVATGLCDDDIGNIKAVKWGRDHEPAARKLIAMVAEQEVIEAGFVFKDETFRVGFSPDYFLLRDGEISGGGQIKCPFDSANYIKFTSGLDLKSEWDWQANMECWVMESSGWWFDQYDPRMLSIPRLHRVLFARDEEKQKALSDKIPKFIRDMDEMLKGLGIKFGDHWHAVRAIREAQQKVGA